MCSIVYFGHVKQIQLTILARRITIKRQNNKESERRLCLRFKPGETVHHRRQLSKTDDTGGIVSRYKSQFAFFYCCQKSSNLNMYENVDGDSSATKRCLLDSVVISTTSFNVNIN